MGTGSEDSNGKVRLSELEQNVGAAQELPPHDRARLGIALRVLSALVLLVLLSGAVLIYGPDDRATQAQTVFDFVKTIAPPIATLVIGFYFRSEAA